MSARWPTLGLTVQNFCPRPSVTARLDAGWICWNPKNGLLILTFSLLPLDTKLDLIFVMEVQKEMKKKEKEKMAKIISRLFVYLKLFAQWALKRCAIDYLGDLAHWA